MLRAFPVVHKAFQNAVFYKACVLCDNAFVVNIYGKGARFAKGCMGKVHHTYQFACHLLIQVMSRNRAAHYQVGFHRMAYSFVGQYARHIRVQHALTHTCVREHAFPFSHKGFVKLVQVLN
jgi:hypothetical protein